MKNNKGKIAIFLGLLLIAAALFLTAYNIYDGFRAGRSADRVIHRLEELIPTENITEGKEENQKELAGIVDDGYAIPEESELPDYVLNPEMEMPEKEINGISCIGVLSIPDLGLELPVISQWSYPNLKVAPCRYAGSAYLNNLVIAAHNYQSHFGMLKNLSQGSAVTFTDADGNVFCYEVAALETLAPTATEEMNSGDYALTLFTCTLDGTSRVTVRCDRIVSARDLL